MDFALTEEEQAIKDLAKQILKDKCTEESLRAIETSDRFIHDAAWKDLVASELVGLVLPESVGGGAMGELAYTILLHQVGRFVAPLPFLPTIAMSAMPIAQYGTEAQKQLVRDVLAGERFLTGALYEGGGTNLNRPLATVTPTANGWALNGTKTNVSLGEIASHAVVNALDPDGNVRLFVVNLSAPGITRETQRQTNFEQTSLVSFSGVALENSDQLGPDDIQDEAVDYLEKRVLLTQAALSFGLAEQALHLTAEFATTREQFGSPIGKFQAVSQRCGDAYIDVASIRLMVWRAAFELARGNDGRREVRVASYWAAEAGHRVVATAQHIHGGMGFDCDYPLHRYFLTMKTLEFALGGARAQLAAFGDELAASTQTGASA